MEVGKGKAKGIRFVVGVQVWTQPRQVARPILRGSHPLLPEGRGVPTPPKLVLPLSEVGLAGRARLGLVQFQLLMCTFLVSFVVCVL